MHVTPAGRSILLAAVTILAVGACGGEDDPVADPTTAPPTTAAPTEEPSPSPTAEPTPTPEQPTADATDDAGLLAAYQAAIDANVAAYNPANPEHPDLLGRYQGDALKTITDDLTGLLAEGHSEVVTYDGKPEIVIHEGNGAIISECYAATVQTIDTATGDNVDAPLEVEQLAESSLRYEDGRWIVVNRTVQEASCS